MSSAWLCSRDPSKTEYSLFSVFLQQPINPLAYSAEAQMFLLQSQLFTDAVVAQVVVQAQFLPSQPVQIASVWLVLPPPEGGVSFKRGLIHQG